MSKALMFLFHTFPLCFKKSLYQSMFSAPILKISAIICVY